MTKRLVAKTGTYQDRQTGEEKGEYAKLGVILSNDNGEYILLDPSVSLSGVLAKQNALAAKQGKPARNMIAVSIFTDQQQCIQQSQSQQPNGYQQQTQQQQNSAGFDDFDDSIPL